MANLIQPVMVKIKKVDGSIIQLKAQEEKRDHTVFRDSESNELLSSLDTMLIIKAVSVADIGKGDTVYEIGGIDYSSNPLTVIEKRGIVPKNGKYQLYEIFLDNGDPMRV